MESGPNEHHIPQFLQRAFGVKPKGKRPTHIWSYSANAAPVEGLISATASEDYFYGKALDEKLKVPETALGAAFSKLRKQPAGDLVDAKLAADLIVHLAPRSKHMRSTFAEGFRHLAEGLRGLFSDDDTVQSMLGLDGDSPNERLDSHLEGLFEREPALAALGLPLPVVSRMAFVIAKEQPPGLFEGVISMFERMLGVMGREAPDLAKDGHVRALDQFLDGPNVRRDLLTTFNWSIEAAPAEGAILPDCVALAYAPDAPVLPVIYAGREMQLVVMPLTTVKLLVGRVIDCELSIGDFNADAAACSQNHFYAHADLPVLRDLSASIGTRAEAYFDDVMQKVVEPYLQASPPSEESGSVADNYDEPLSGYNVLCFDFGDQGLCQRLADAVAPIVNSAGKFLPLGRLEGITFAADVAAAMYAFNHWDDPATANNPPADLPEIGGTGSATMFPSDGRTMVRLFFGLPVIECLLSDDEAATDWKLQWIIHQLARVALVELADRAFSDDADKQIAGQVEQKLWPYVEPSLGHYVAARFSGYFGGGAALATHYRNSLIHAVNEMRPAVISERTAYFEHRNVEPITYLVAERSADILNFAAALLAHCESAGEPVYDDEGRLSEALETAGLSNWIGYFAKQLEAMFGRLGRWKSLNELLVFTMHMERLFWSVGVVVWEIPGGMWVAVGGADDLSTTE